MTSEEEDFIDKVANVSPQVSKWVYSQIAAGKSIEVIKAKFRQLAAIADLSRDRPAPLDI